MPLVGICLIPGPHSIPSLFSVIKESQFQQIIYKYIITVKTFEKY